MSSSEKFSLKWNDFQENIVSSFQHLRKETEFSDVTLVCEDNHTIEAHRIILTACSPLFSTMLKRTNNYNPIIYMMGVKAKDLVAIVDFIYHGEANIYQDDLDGFLALAEKLQLKPNFTEDEDNTNETMAPTKTKIKANLQPMSNFHEYKEKTESSLQVESEKDVDLEQIDSRKYSKSYSILESNDSNYEHVPADDQKIRVYANMEDIKGQIDSIMEKATDGDYKCALCGKYTKKRQDMSRHIETHIKGIKYPCDQCGKLQRSSYNLKRHIFKFHK